MAGNLNKVMFIGRVVRDPELRHVQSGAAVTKFSIAINPQKKDPKPEETTYPDIIAWEKLAETCNTYLKSGMSVYVEGRLSQRAYDDKNFTDKDGKLCRRKVSEFVIHTMQMLESAKPRNGEPGEPVHAGQSFGGDGSDGYYDDSEIPF
jgi:single-strand DNA-binding protein